MKEILTIGSFIAVIVFSMIGYNLYTNAENRKQYELCLKMKNENITTSRYNTCYPPR